MGLTNWAEFAVFRGFKPDDWVFGTEFGLLTKEPYLLSVGFVNWSPHLDVDPQPYIEAGYYTEHHKFIAGGIHAGYKPRDGVRRSDVARLVARDAQGDCRRADAGLRARGDRFFARRSFGRSSRMFTGRTGFWFR
jgi:hypothetical protein